MKFGYQVINGKYAINKIQAEIINESMLDYIKGVSLKTKAEQLSSLSIEYAPGKSLWNKNRVQRMLTDEAYIGLKNFPAIVQEEIFYKVKSVMEERNTQKSVNRDEIFNSAIIPIRCGQCGWEVGRRFESRTKEPKVYRVCENPDCDKSYIINDIDLRIMVRDKLALTNEIVKDSAAELNREIYRLENEIERDLQSIEIDEQTVKNKIFECAALKYSKYNTPKGSIDYEKINLCSLEFNKEVKHRVKAVILESNNQITLYMNDGQIVGKDFAEI